MPDFQTPPDWWLNLANLTLWAYWPAWAAIFSLAALWNTARLADRSSRREQRKDSLIVVAAAQFLDLGVTTYEAFVEDVEIGPVSMALVLASTDYNDDRGIMNTLHDFDVSKFPTVYAFKVFGYGRHALVRLEDMFKKSQARGALPDLEKTEQFVRMVQESIADMREHARKSTTANDWARLHGQTPPYSWAGTVQWVKSLPAKFERE